MDFPLDELLSDERYREVLAEQSYYRERLGEKAEASEHDVDDNVEYLCVKWESLSDRARRPYRTSVAEACDNIASVFAAAV